MERVHNAETFEDYVGMVYLASAESERKQWIENPRQCAQLDCSMWSGCPHSMPDDELWRIPPPGWAEEVLALVLEV